MNIIDERDKRTKKRKKAKAKFDKDITLSSSLSTPCNKCRLSLNKSEGTVRLLDEGSIVTADGSLDFYIKKGAIRKYVSGKNTKLTYGYVYGDYSEKLGVDPDTPMNITEKYTGSINVGHLNFAEFPFTIVGEWNVNDLSLANNEDGRKGLDVDLKLNEAHPVVQAFRVQGIPLGVSVEMFLHLDDKATKEETERRAEYTPVVDEVFISDFAIVGECGNVGSSGSVDFQGVKMDGKNEFDPILEEVAEENEMEEEIKEVDPVEESVAEETEETVKETIEEAEETEEAVEDATEESDDNEDAKAEEPEEDEEVEVDEADNGEETENEEVTLSMVLDKVNELTNKVSELASQNDMLKKQNRKLKGKLQAKNEEEKKFFQGLSLSLGGEPKKEEKKEHEVLKDYANGDGIGE